MAEAQVADTIEALDTLDGAEADRRARVAELGDRIGGLCANIDAGLAELVSTLGEFDDLEGWADEGAVNPPQWLSWRANVAPHAGRDMFALARALKDLPKVKDAFSSGDLTYWQARAIARVADHSSEDVLIHLAQHSTVAQLSRICSAYTRVGRQHAPATAHDHRMFGYHFDDEGFMEVYARLCPEDAAIFEQAITAVGERLRKEQEENTTTTRGWSQRSADALVEMARIALSDDGEGNGSSPSHEVMVHVDLDTLTTREGRCHVDGGPALAPTVVERILCDSFLTTAVERDGVVIDVSKRRRTATARQKKALMARDHMCLFPGCSYRRFVQAHHVEYYVRDDGETVLINLGLLCWEHHRLVHDGFVSMTPGPDGGFVFHDRDGNVIDPVPPKPEGSVDLLVQDNEARGLELTPETPKSGWDGGPVSLVKCVDAIYTGRAIYDEAERPPPMGGPDPPEPSI